MIFSIFMLKTLIEVVLTCTHNLCFGSEIRKLGINFAIYMYKSGV